MNNKEMMSFLDVVTIIAKEHNLPVEIVENIIIVFLKVLCDSVRRDFNFPNFIKGIED